MKHQVFFRLLSAAIVLTTFALSSLYAQSPGPVIVGGNSYAFYYSGGTNYGLYFNLTGTAYEFKDGTGATVFSVNANSGRVDANGTFYANSNIRFGATSDLLIDADRYAFRYRLGTNYGLFFNATQARYEFRNASASPVFWVGANNGFGWFGNGIRVGNSTSTEAGSIRYNGSDFEGYDGTNWVSFTSGGGPTSWTVSGNNQYSSVSGNVGIGNASPWAKLVVGTQAADANGPNMVIGVNDFYNNANSGILYFEENIQASNLGMNCGFKIAHDGADNALRIISGCPTQDTIIDIRRGGAIYFPKLGGSGTLTLQVDNSGLVSGVASSSGLPSGTSGQTLRHDGSAWVANGNIWNTGSNVGVGTSAAPTARFQVDGNSASTQRVIQAITNYSGTSDVRAVYGSSVPADGYGYGGEFIGGWYGVYGTASSGAYTGTGYGVRGLASGTAGTRYGGYFTATSTGPTTNYGVYGAASGATTNWAGYFVGNVYSSGDLGLRTTTPGSDLHINQSASPFPDPTTGGIRLTGSGNTWQIWHSNPYLSFAINGTRVAYVNNSTGAWTVTSDRRMKRNIQEMEDVLDKVMQLRPVNYQYNHNQDGSPIVRGFIAQEVQEIFPELVSTEDGSQLALAPADFGILAIKAIQEMKAENEELKEMISEQGRQIEMLINEIRAVKACTNCDGHKDAFDQMGNSSDRARLEQNLPNPFNGKTKIGYYLPQNTTNAQLVMFDMKGQMIQTFPLSGSGNGSVEFGSGELPSGVYLYTLMVNGVKVDTKRMVLNR